MLRTKYVYKLFFEGMEIKDMNPKARRAVASECREDATKGLRVHTYITYIHFYTLDLITYLELSYWTSLKPSSQYDANLGVTSGVSASSVTA